MRDSLFIDKSSLNWIRRKGLLNINLSIFKMKRRSNINWSILKYRLWNNRRSILINRLLSDKKRSTRLNSDTFLLLRLSKEIYFMLFVSRTTNSLFYRTRHSSKAVSIDSIRNLNGPLLYCILVDGQLDFVLEIWRNYTTWLSWGVYISYFSNIALWSQIGAFSLSEIGKLLISRCLYPILYLRRWGNHCHWLMIIMIIRRLVSYLGSTTSLQVNSRLLIRIETLLNKLSPQACFIIQRWLSIHNVIYTSGLIYTI